jgi:uncharacterized protein YndB with AHSA1/START domain
MRVEREVEIARSPEEVFAFVADARNDPRWCPKVSSCEQVEGDGPGPGARYLARHRPTKLKPTAELRAQVLELDPPRCLRRRDEDDDGVYEVTYLLDPAGAGTRFTQRSDVEWKLPRVLQLIASRMVPGDLEAQMKALKRELEGG